MKKNRLIAAIFGALVLFFCAADSAFAQPTDAQRDFFSNLKRMCERSFDGATEFPLIGDHPLIGKRLVMRVASCTEREIRIPFEVGADKSRTWILTLTERGLLFKHDHRHADGTPDKITNYGGRATGKGTSLAQSFPADEETARLIPEAETNVWTLRFDEEKRSFMYRLERNGALRYRAVFKIPPPIIRIICDK